MSMIDEQLAYLYDLRISEENSEPGTLSLIDGYECEKCLNRGFITVKSIQTGMPVRQYCECLNVREKLKKASASGLGNLLSKFKFSNFEATEPWQQNLKTSAIEFCQSDNSRWFFVGGQSGAGKTHICTAMCANYLKKNKDLIYMSWPEDSKKLKAVANEIFFQHQIDIFKNTEVLYIDDFLKPVEDERPTRADVILAFEIVNSRLYDPKKVTIISSEISLDELIDIDEATMSRIFQVCGKYKLTINKDRSRNYRLRHTYSPTNPTQTQTNV